MDKKTLDVKTIVQDLKDCGYAVERVGYRWRVTDPDPESKLLPQFMPAVLASKNVKPMIDRLAFHGYDISQVDAVRAARHAEAVEDGNRKAAVLLAEAEEKAKARAAEDAAMAAFVAQVEEYNRQEAAKRMAGGAVAVDTVKFDRVELDAKFAEELLKHNDMWQPSTPKDGRTLRRSNRPVSWDWINSMRDDMVLGNWVFVPQGIALDWNGNMLDGQQRCLALIEADKIKPGITIPMLISYDWDPEVFDRIDQGRNRSLTDLLGLIGETNRLLYSTALRLAYRFDDDPAIKGWRTRVSDHELLGYAERSELNAQTRGYPSLRETLHEGAAIAKGAKMIASAAIVGLYVCRRAWPTAPHQEFVEGLRLGYIEVEGGRLPLETRDARVALRNYLAGTGKKRGNGTNATHLALYIKTWRLWLLRRQVTLIKLGPNELFPTPPSGPIVE